MTILPLYTRPQPAREWVGLTDEQVNLMAHNDDPGDWNDPRYQKCWREGYAQGVRAAEAKLKEKNA